MERRNTGLAAHQVVSFDHMDMDGYALRWGSDHIALSLADYGRRRHGEIREIWTSSLADCGSRASLLTRNYY